MKAEKVSFPDLSSTRVLKLYCGIYGYEGKFIEGQWNWLLWLIAMLMLKKRCNAGMTDSGMVKLKKKYAVKMS